MTISDLLLFAKKNIEAQDAKLLAMEAFGFSDVDLFLHKDTIPSAKQKEQFLCFIEKRKKGHSVSEILGRRDFYGLEFIVTNDVLTPRPETEWCIDFAQNFQNPISKYIDVGTGSGCIAVTLATVSSKKVIALDISEKALLVAQKNAERLNVLHLIDFRHSDLFSAVLHSEVQNAGIIANLPYIPSSDILSDEVLFGDPALALFSGSDGLDLYRRFFAQLPDGFAFCAFEFHPPQQLELLKMITSHFSQKQVSFHSDLSGDIRFGVIR